MKRKLLQTLIIFVFLIGFLLVFINPIQQYVIQRTSQQLLTENIVEDSPAIEASFDFQEVQTLQVQDVLKAQLNKKNFTVIGSVTIPSVNLALPIGKGVSESVIAVGAGTMKPEQKLGEGNYALASHYIEGQNILFGPLYNVKLGDITYISDQTFIYEYVIIKKEIISDSDVHVIYDVPNKTLLTFITCAEKGTKRLLVQGEFIKKFSINTK